MPTAGFLRGPKEDGDLQLDILIGADWCPTIILTLSRVRKWGKMQGQPGERTLLCTTRRKLGWDGMNHGWPVRAGAMAEVEEEHILVREGIYRTDEEAR